MNFLNLFGRKRNKSLNYISLFSGIGAFEKALDRLNIPYNLIGFSDIDKYAAKSYCAIHGVDESKNLGDITKIDEKALPKNIDLITYGFPCQDISNAGKQKGMFECEHCHSRYELEEGDAEKIRNGDKFFCEKCGNEIKLTRSGLFFEALRIIEETRPKVAIAENVKNLTSKRFSEQFKIVLESLEAAGYTNHWKVLNAKDFGVPQNRERVFIVSIRNDIDSSNFKFPEGFPLDLRLKDILEHCVDEKYYISETAMNGFIKRKEENKAKGSGFGFSVKNEEEIANTILSRYYKDGQDCLIAESPEEEKNQAFLEVREATKQGYAEAFEGDSINLEHPNSKTRRGRVGRGVAQTLTTSPQQAVVEPFIVASRGRNPENPSDRTAGAPTVQRLEPNSRGISNTLTTVQKDNYVAEPAGNILRIRKLTPKECFRLMDFDDADFEKAAAVNSASQLYKQAGNSIVVSVPQAIIKELTNANIL